jgi:hypothetical protein|nr:MAG TPA: Helix-turn-helix of DDE superfamily endonuclease [Bacteriophage sp.]
MQNMSNSELNSISNTKIITLLKEYCHDSVARDMAVMRLVEGATYIDIAHIFNVSQSTARRKCIKAENAVKMHINE